MTHFHTQRVRRRADIIQVRQKTKTWVKTRRRQRAYHQLLLSFFLGRDLILTTLNTLKLSASPLLKSLPLPPLLPFTLLFTHPDSTLLLCSVHLSSLLLHISVHFSHHLFPISRLSHLLYYHSLASLLLFSTSSPLLPVTSPILLSSLSFSTSFALPV